MRRNRPVVWPHKTRGVYPFEQHKDRLDCNVYETKLLHEPRYLADRLRLVLTAFKMKQTVKSKPNALVILHLTYDWSPGTIAAVSIVEFIRLGDLHRNTFYKVCSKMKVIRTCFFFFFLNTKHFFEMFFHYVTITGASNILLKTIMCPFSLVKQTLRSK